MQVTIRDHCFEVSSLADDLYEISSRSHLGWYRHSVLVNHGNLVKLLKGIDPYTLSLPEADQNLLFHGYFPQAVPALLQQSGEAPPLQMGLIPSQPVRAVLHALNHYVGLLCVWQHETFDAVLPKHHFGKGSLRLSAANGTEQIVLHFQQAAKTELAEMTASSQGITGVYLSAKDVRQMLAGVLYEFQPRSFSVRVSD